MANVNIPSCLVHTNNNMNSSNNVVVVKPDCKNSMLACLKRKRPPRLEIPDVLQEIEKSSVKFQDFGDKDNAVCFSGDGYCVSSVKGKKKFMEDTHRVLSPLEGYSAKGFFGVYDGHGGRKAAEFVAENLHKNILEMLKSSGADGSKEEAVKAGYMKTDQEFLKLGVESGACCVTALIEGTDLVVSNVGDCRAVLSRGGIAEVLTNDHTAEKDAERRRIESKGGYVELHRGAWRVHGVLAVSRSIGDTHLKDWVLAEPDTKVLNMTPHMEFLVLASDGLWNEVGNQEAVDTIARIYLDSEKAGGANALHNVYEDDNYGCINLSPPSKIRRISLVKQQKLRNLSPIKIKTVDGSKDDMNDFDCENYAPPPKARRISLVKRLNVKARSPSPKNRGHNQTSNSTRLEAACRELMNLAVTRGSLDDITVIIIDLKHFKCNI